MNKKQLISIVTKYTEVISIEKDVNHKMYVLFGGFEGCINDLLVSYYQMFWETLSVASGELVDLSVIEHWIECKYYSNMDVMYYHKEQWYCLNDLERMVDFAMFIGDSGVWFENNNDLIVEGGNYES